MNLALDINVILVQPQYAINVGYTARLCKIFQVKELIVVSPACDIYCHEAQLAATHGEHNLKNSIVVHKLSEARKYCHTLAAFSAQVGGQHLCSSILRTPWDVEDFAKQICSRSSERKPACTDKGPCQNEVCNSNSYSVGLVFGREASGLLNTEIKTCDFLVTIPVESQYRVFNLSHSVAVALYVLHRTMLGQQIPTMANIPLAAGEDKLMLGELWSQIVGLLPLNESRSERVVLALQHVIGRAMISEAECRQLETGLRMVLRKLKHQAQPQKYPVAEEE